MDQFIPRLLIIASIIGICNLNAKCQSHAPEEINESKSHSKHMLGVMIGYAWVPQTISSQGDQGMVIIPSIGVDYGYYLGHHFSLVFVNDIELSSYIVEDADGAKYERDNKYIGAITVLYHITPVIGLYAGPGIELDKNYSFAIVKAGFDLVKHFDEGWAVAFNASIDVNDAYQTISAGLVVSKNF